MTSIVPRPTAATPVDSQRLAVAACRVSAALAGLVLLVAVMLTAPTLKLLNRRR